MIMGLIFILMLVVTVIWNVFFPTVSFNNAYDELKDLNQTEINEKIYETVQETVIAGLNT